MDALTVFIWFDPMFVEITQADNQFPSAGVVLDLKQVNANAF
jgi:hypothetical protein